ncbi:unnamed protein product [Lasius platythorax]|uniref:Uncharacterized protein n=1 Tax=Lasius platythorax TaxID=488582 RepID=A0AAV2NIE4_9HYME
MQERATPHWLTQGLRALEKRHRARDGSLISASDDNANLIARLTKAPILDTNLTLPFARSHERNFERRASRGPFLRSFRQDASSSEQQSISEAIFSMPLLISPL